MKKYPELWVASVLLIAIGCCCCVEYGHHRDRELLRTATSGEKFNARRHVEMPFDFYIEPNLYVNVHLTCSDGPLTQTPMVMRYALSRGVTPDEVVRLAMAKIVVEGGHYERPLFAGYAAAGDAYVAYTFVPASDASPLPPIPSDRKPGSRVRRLLGDGPSGPIGAAP